MRYFEITEAAKKVIPVEWPTDLVWRIPFRRYKDVPAIISLRENKIFAMPFRNWEATYYKLTGKETTKIKNTPTQVLRVQGHAIVADMALWDKALNCGAEYSKMGREVLEQYERTAVTYEEFVSSPEMFGQPEILLDRASVELLPFRATIADYVRGEGYQLGLLAKTV